MLKFNNVKRFLQTHVHIFNKKSFEFAFQQMCRIAESYYYDRNIRKLYKAT